MARSALEGSHGLPVSASMPITSLPPGTGVSAAAAAVVAAPPAAVVAAPPPAAVVPALLPLSSLPHAAATRAKARPPATRSAPVRRRFKIGRFTQTPPLTRAPRPQSIAATRPCGWFPLPAHPLFADPWNVTPATRTMAREPIAALARCQRGRGRVNGGRPRGTPAEARGSCWLRGVRYCLIQTDWMLKTPAMPLQRHALSPDGRVKSSMPWTSGVCGRPQRSQSPQML